MKKLVSLILIVSIVIAGVSPALADVNKSRERYENVKSDYLESKRVFEKAAQDMRKANEGKEKLQSLWSDEHIETAKDHLLNSCDLMITQLEDLYERVEEHSSFEKQDTVLNEILTKTQQLESLKSEIREAEAGVDLIKIGVKVRQEWITFRVTLKRITGHVMWLRARVAYNKIDNLVANAESMVDRLENAGIDTTRYSEILESIKEDIEIMKDKVERAKAEFEEIKDTGDAEELFKKGHEYIKAANAELKEIYQEIRELIQSIKENISSNVVREKGTGKLTASGDGIVVIKGSTGEKGIIEISGNGTLIIQDNNRDMNLDISGFGNREDLGDNKVKYTGEGNATITGSDVRVELKGTGIDLTAMGRGVVLLKGEGAYSVESIRKNWLPDKQTEIEITE